MQEIIKSIEKIKEFLREVPLSDSTLSSYHCTFTSILAYCERNGIACFSKDAAQAYITILNNKCKSGNIGDRYLRKLRRSACLLSACMEGENLTLKRAVFPARTLNDYYADVLIDFENHISQSLAPGSIRGIVSTIRKFLFYLEDGGILSIALLKAEHVKRFLNRVAKYHTGSMGNLMWALRRFMLFVNETSLSSINADRYLLNPAPNRKKVLPCFTNTETDAILSSVDKTTGFGKRDYAILKLAVETGLRNVDILHLKLSDINWYKCEIAVIQEKTGEAVHLPLLASVGNAIADYILHERPESLSPHVFLRSVRPYTKLCNPCNGSNILNRYLYKAGIVHKAWDGKTFHAFRRTQGTRLVEAEVPLPDISDMLGHKLLNSAKRYISHSDKKLRACCLGISEYAVQKEGLV
jgi:integrase